LALRSESPSGGPQRKGWGDGPMNRAIVPEVSRRRDGGKQERKRRESDDAGRRGELYD